MGLIESIKDLFRKGGAKVGMVKTLVHITDDERIHVPQREYDRIVRAKHYYADDFPKVKYKNSYGDLCDRQLSSINMTKQVARRLASLIFNEQCNVAANQEDDAAHVLIDKVLKASNFYTNYEERLERGISTGGMAIMPYVEDDQIKLSWINAEQFYPLQSNTTEIKEAAIADQTTVQEGKKTWFYTMLEFHEWQKDEDGAKVYHIKHELYKSDKVNEVGMQVPLGSLEKYANLQEEATINEMTTPLFAYFKTPGDNNITPESPLGLGVVDNAANTIDAINLTHDQFVHEIKMGKRRIAVPSEMLRPGVRFDNKEIDLSHPQMFDKNVDVYEAMYGQNDLKITDLTSSIRNDQYQASMQFFLNELESEIGLSAGTFTTDGQGVKTATEIVSENSKTYQTRSSYLTQVEEQLTTLVRAILYTALSGDLFSDGKPRWTGDVDDVEITIDFNDGVFVDQEAQFNKDMQMVTGSMMPRYMFLVRNLGIDEDKAKQLIAESDAETKEPDALIENSMFGGDGNANTAGHQVTGG